MNPENDAVDDRERAEASAVSRRDLFTGAGAVAAGVAAVVSAPAFAADDQGGLAGVAKPGINAAEFRFWVEQSGASGERFVGYGFLTKLADVADDALFTGEPTDASTALLTLYAEGKLEQRSFGQSVHILDIAGSLTIYQRSAPGASPGDPASFQVGTSVARFALTLQDVLTVFAPGRGIPALAGDLQQTAVGRLEFPGKGGGKSFGRPGLRARLSATGLGERPNSATFDTRFEMGGNWTIE